jgi:WD40 repeat protein
VAVTSESSNDRVPGSVTIYDTARKAPVAAISHAAKINDAQFSRDGRFLVTGGADQAIRIWDLEAGRQVSEIQASAAIDKVRFVDGGRYVEALSDDPHSRQVITRYRWKVDDLVSALAARKEQLRRES